MKHDVLSKITSLFEHYGRPVQNEKQELHQRTETTSLEAYEHQQQLKWIAHIKKREYNLDIEIPRNIKKA